MFSKDWFITENAVVWPTRPERNHLIVPIHASMMLHPYMFTLPSGIYMPYYHLLENTSFHSVEENISLRKHANLHAFFVRKVEIRKKCEDFEEFLKNICIYQKKTVILRL